MFIVKPNRKRNVKQNKKQKKDENRYPMLC